VGTALAGPVVVSGTCGVGYTLTASDPSAQTGATLLYTWYLADDDESSGTQVSTGTSYTPVRADFGKYLYVTAADSSGTYVGTLTSDSTAVVITGTFPSCPSASWTITPDGKITFEGVGTVSDQYGSSGFYPTAPWVAYQSLISSAIFRSGVTYTHLDDWFLDCASLTSVSMPVGFGQTTQSMSEMFYACTSLGVFIPPSGFGQNATRVDGMFSSCTNLMMLDLSGMSTLKASLMSEMFLGCSSLRRVKLGANWSFKGDGSTALCQLPDPAAPYSLWRAVGQGTAADPLGSVYTAADLASAYTGSMADTYVWAPPMAGTVSITGTPVAGSTVTAVPLNTPGDASLSYTWYSAPDTTSVGTQVGTTVDHAVVASDQGAYLYVAMSDSSGKYTGSIVSDRVWVTAPLAGPVVVAGTPALVGQALAASDPSAQAGSALSWAWYVAADTTSDGTLAGGGTAYTPVAADYGKYVYATVSDTSGKYTGTLYSFRYQVGAVLSVTVPTSMPLVAAGSGAVTGAQAQASNASLVPVHVSSLSAAAVSPFSLVASASFDAVSGQNLLSLLLAPGGGSAIDLAAYQTAAQPPAGQWNMAAAGGALSLTPSGRLKNATAAISSTPVHAVDLSWSFAAGSL
jgi:hypothetical protein